MIMFLTILLASVPVLLLAAIALKSSSPPGRESTERRKVDLPASRFFAEEPVADAPSRLPRELVLSQIERHFRTEHAAAEQFLALPSEESLYSGTGSPALN
jgi:hypothetical protein